MGQYFDVEYTQELIWDLIPRLTNTEEVTLMKEMCYSNNVYELRASNHITQEQLAKKVGVCPRTISLIENNEQNLSLDIAYRIAAYFKVPIFDVFPPNMIVDPDPTLS